ncbi:hypothetical protein [Streptomyces sp. AS02]|uniref:hypothetical protein n=1 Tax=Streptomyces sp. AS02 TaxID=2938946 RepID=UPI002021EB33|nr:hypothetical protein [Streptomyces sp. AS02]MCL8016943.1 hypothetical protein [Streptomyces sp. AS02]
MPEILSEPQRWVIPAVLIVSVVGTPLYLWWEKRRPSVPAYVAEMRGWRRLSTAQQAAADREAIVTAAFFEEVDAEARQRAEEAARLAVERAAQINALTRP